jgi:4,5-DOPA dioxygenase extradiol
MQGEDRKKAVCKLNQDPGFRKCHPTAEHLVPLHVAVGAAGDDQAVKVLDDYFSTIGWASYQFSSEQQQQKTEL